MSRQYDHFMTAAEEFLLEQSNIIKTMAVGDAVVKLKKSIQSFYPETEKASLEHPDDLVEKLSEIRILFEEFKSSAITINAKNTVDKKIVTDFTKVTEELITEMDAKILKLIDKTPSLPTDISKETKPVDQKQEQSDNQLPQTFIPVKKVPLKISELKKLGEKLDGKNVNSANGIYESLADGEKHFVKKPDDPREFFTELFAGLVITGLLEKNFIPESYRDSIIPAKEVLMGDGSYGLIQPFREFVPLHMLLDNNMGNQKFVLAEVLKKSIKGKGYENIVQENTVLIGLSYALMIKFLLADYSVHDGNIGVVESNIQTKDAPIKKLLSFIAFDFGAAFRAISRTEKSENIYTSLEEKDRLFNFYKEYPRLYSNMPELFEKIKSHAQDLKANIASRELEFYGLIKDALERTFHSFKENFSHDTKTWEKNRNDLLKYMYKNDPNLPNLIALNDSDLPIKLATDMFKFLIDRSDRLSVAAAPTPLNQGRVKRYNSIGDAAAEMAKIAQQGQTSTSQMSAALTPATNIMQQQHFSTLHDKSGNVTIGQAGEYTKPTVEKKIKLVAEKKEAQQTQTITPQKAH